MPARFQLVIDCGDPELASGRLPSDTFLNRPPKGSLPATTGGATSGFPTVPWPTVRPWRTALRRAAGRRCARRRAIRIQRARRPALTSTLLAGGGRATVRAYHPVLRVSAVGRPRLPMPRRSALLCAIVTAIAAGWAGSGRSASERQAVRCGRGRPGHRRRGRHRGGGCRGGRCR
jgi:hypothetical protein